jgi:hypothetical protein
VSEAFRELFSVEGTEGAGLFTAAMKGVAEPLTPEALERGFAAIANRPNLEPKVEIISPRVPPACRRALPRLIEARAWVRVELAVCPRWNRWRRRHLERRLRDLDFVIMCNRRYGWVGVRF